MKKILCAVVTLSVVGLTAHAQVVTSGWEDWPLGSSGVLGTFGDNLVTTVTDELALSGSQSLKLVEDPLSGTPQAYLAWVTGVSEGDTITASVWCYGTGTTAKGRLWGHYSTATDINAYQGSASGPADYIGIGQVWQAQTNTWTVAAGQEAFVLEGRIYSYDSDNHIVYYDDLAISSSNPNAVITVIPEPTTFALGGFGLLALLLARRRS